ncbi:MAG: radical SAM protein [Candidatus Diapherotrites archaeon]|uniref:Radical SAM protein n=1 Tax=Candidatus Iainarchaeum sp. TaxID=3101447 RepID=A0A938YUG4_9ARCH|nr:radical SAM protein [Candidatus Diapherotrites archaeon]
MQLDKPLEVKIELTQNCNLGCSFCFNAGRPKASSELGKMHLKKVLQRIADEGIESVRFTGGEPLLREGIIPLLSFAKGLGLHVKLNTNATLIDKSNASSLAENVDDFLVSMHAFDAESERKLCASPYFEKKLEAVELLASQGCFLRAATILARQNIAQLEKGHALISSMPFSQWVLLRPIPNIVECSPLGSSDVATAVEKLLRFNEGKPDGEKFFIENALPFCSYNPEKVEQVALGGIYEDGHSSLAVDSKGIVKPSYFIDVALGNALKDSFFECWNSPFMQRLRSLDFVPGECRGCRHLMKCKAGSRFSALFVNNSFSALDPLAMPGKYALALFH